MSRRYLRDLAERVAWTFLQGALGAITVGGVLGLHDLRSAANAIAIGGSAAVLSLLKGLVARKVGDSESAALFVDGSRE